MKKTRVHLGSRSYSIHVGGMHKLTRSLRNLNLHPSRILIVTSKPILQAGHVKQVKKAFSVFEKPVLVVTIPDGESHKNLDTLKKLYSEGLAFGLDRKSCVVAVGGGVITDLVGFFAATYMRGLSFISVPTTLLAMVDAAIGGKTGVDLAQGKNLVGAFWQPKLVWIDPKVLTTLPLRQWRTGMAEVVKYGVIKNSQFFSWLERQVRKDSDVRRWSKDDIEKILIVSTQTKAEVVSQDEVEVPLAGGREILNFGHTLGHALEAATGYHELTHGEAISVGMVLVGKMALNMDLWSEKEQWRLSALLLSLGLPVSFPKLTSRQLKIFWSALLKDKKNVAGNLRFVLPVSLGKVKVRSGIHIDAVKKIL